MKTRMQYVALICLVSFLAISKSALAANECKFLYSWNSGNTFTGTYKNQSAIKYLNYGQKTTLNKNRMNYVKNMKSTSIKLTLTNVTVSPFTLTGMARNPGAGNYVGTSPTKLVSVECLNAAPGSGGGSNAGNSSGSINLGGLTTVPLSPQLPRPLTSAEKSLVRSVFGSSITFSNVKITNTVGLNSGYWVSKVPTGYLVNVGTTFYAGLTASSNGRLTLIHEMVHVWQGQHNVPFTSNSALHQALSVAQTGSTSGAYDYGTAGKQWNKYNVEQQADIVRDWYAGGKRTSSTLYPYIRDNVRSGRPNGKTTFATKRKKSSR